LKPFTSSKAEQASLLALLILSSRLFESRLQLCRIYFPCRFAWTEALGTVCALASFKYFSAQFLSV